MNRETQKQNRKQIGGLAGWLLARLRREAPPARRLVLLERIALGPRQHLALVEADGQSFLIATGSDAAPVLHALHGKTKYRPAPSRRVSW